MNRFRAFTLVELLVVIGIIAILIAILLPTLARVRDSGKTAQCLSNLRQIGQAFHLYASETRGWLVPGFIEAAGGGGSGIENWCTILVNARYLPAPKQIAIDFDAQESEGTSIFRCPSGLNMKHDVGGADADPQPDSKTSGYNSFFWRRKSTSTGVQIDTWYAINANDNPMNANAQKRWPMRTLQRLPGGFIQGGPQTKLTQIRRSSEMALVLDGLRMIDGKPNRMSARHNGQKLVNIMMGDGHCESVHASQLPQVESDMQGNQGAITLSEKYPHPRWRMDQP